MVVPMSVLRSLTWATASNRGWSLHFGIGNLARVWAVGSAPKFCSKDKHKAVTKFLLPFKNSTLSRSLIFPLRDSEWQCHWMSRSLRWPQVGSYECGRSEMGQILAHLHWHPWSQLGSLGESAGWLSIQARCGVMARAFYGNELCSIWRTWKDMINMPSLALGSYLWRLMYCVGYWAPCQKNIQ